MQTFDLTDEEAEEFATEDAHYVINRTRHRTTGRRLPLVLISMVAATCLIVGVVLASKNNTHDDASTSVRQPSTGTRDSSGMGTNDSSGTVTSPPSTQSSDPCDALFICQTGRLGQDRLGHEMPLVTGISLCNAQYRFGVTKDGVFQLHDCDANISNVIHVEEPLKIAYFSMTSNGTFGLFDTQDQVLWQKAPKTVITPTTQCLHNPQLDCPYLHLHASGDVVLNSVSNGQWSDRKIEKSFDNLFL